ncbi:MAG: OmpA family protein [bacterium]
MKNTLSYVGWLAFLAVLAVGLILYNAVHLPVARRLARQQNEIGMWTVEVESLRAQAGRAAAPAETAFAAVFTFEELFGASEGLAIGAGGEGTLRGIVTMLQQAPGAVTVSGHTDSAELPAKVKGLYPSHWHYGAAAAASVCWALAAWGVGADRLEVRSAGAGRPRDSNATAEGRARNRRVEILIIKGR